MKALVLLIHGLINIMTKISSVEKRVEELFGKHPLRSRSFENKIRKALTTERAAGAREYKQFILNVLAGIDIADGECNTKAIRLAIASRIIE